MDATYERTKYEALMDIDYAIELHQRHIRLYRHLRWIFNFVFLASGTAIFAGTLATEPAMAKWTGGALAILVIIDHLLNTGGKIYQHQTLMTAWCKLHERADGLELAELDRRISKLRSKDVHIISALEMVSYATNLQRHGRASSLPRKLSLWERFMGLLA